MHDLQKKADENRGFAKELRGRFDELKTLFAELNRKGIDKSRLAKPNEKGLVIMDASDPRRIPMEMKDFISRCKAILEHSVNENEKDEIRKIRGEAETLLNEKVAPYFRRHLPIEKLK